MKCFTVLFDAECALCCRARSWLERQHQLVPLRFVAAASTEAQELFPTLDHSASLNELTVVDPLGYVFRGAKAWIVCFWALSEYRSIASTLSAPGALRLAKRLVTMVSHNRHRMPVSMPPSPPAPGGCS